MELAFSSLNDFIAMGRHGFYVWLCFGLTIFVVILNLAIVRVRKMQIVESIKKEVLRQKKQLENTAGKPK